MPKATAAWLVQNTTLSFRQIATFCHLHNLEVKAIADGDARATVGFDPIFNQQLTLEEIRRCESDPKADLKTVTQHAELLNSSQGKSKNYLSRAHRRDRPDGILWVVLNRPNATDADIIKLLGTTKKTVQSIRNKSYKRYKELKARNPVMLGVCSQEDLDKIPH